MPCQCSLNSQKKRGKCGACARFDESLVGPPSRPEPTRTNGCARGVDPGIQNWMAIASSSDGAKLALIYRPQAEVLAELEQYKDFILTGKD